MMKKKHAGEYFEKQRNKKTQKKLTEANGCSLMVALFPGAMHK